MSRKQLLKKVETVLENAAAVGNDTPVLVVYKPDGSRLVLGFAGRHLPDVTPIGLGTKVFVGIDPDAI